MNSSVINTLLFNRKYDLNHDEEESLNKYRNH